MKKMLFVLLILFFQNNNLVAENIKFKSGESVKGPIVERTDTSITLDFSKGRRITYYLVNIASIDGEEIAIHPSFEEKNEEYLERLELLADDFVNKYVSALQNKDKEALVSMLLPASRACKEDAYEKFYNKIYTAKFDFLPIPEERSYRVGAVGMNFALTVGMYAMQVPEEPTHTILIDWTEDLHNSSTLSINIAIEDDKIYEVLPCPTEETIRIFSN